LARKFTNLGRKEEGFSLLEILAAITILSVASLAMTAFFVNAMSYAKGNQNKTIVVNLARNALFYTEKQSFDGLKDYFVTQGNLSISAEGCSLVGETVSCPQNQSLENLFKGMTNIWDVLNPEVNGRSYSITISYEQVLLPEDGSEKYLLPIKVKAKDVNEPSGKRNWSEVEGYVTDEKIR
jgi:prepilin-type N-terminal cleavage/methylation domain-containing protein